MSKKQQKKMGTLDDDDAIEMEPVSAARAVGRPTEFKEEYCDLVERLCALDIHVDDEKMAAFFGVSKQTIYNWQRKYPQFLDSVRAGKVLSDVDVAISMRERAKGYRYLEAVPTKVKETIYGENGKKLREIEKVEITMVERVVPPDTTAGKYWLGNRHPDKWRERKELEIGRPGEFDGMKTEELRELAQHMAIELGIEAQEDLQPSKTPNTKGSDTVN